MNLDEDIIKRDLYDLLSYFSKQTYSASGCDERAERILARCVDLFLKDYDISVLSNRNGELCGHYPEKIIIVESELLTEDHILSDGRIKINDVFQLKPLIAKARLARCRSRFVVPVISFNGKNICRSATLSSMAEIVGRSGLNFLFSSPVFPEDASSQENDNEWDLLNKSRSQDIQLLKALRVKYIFDLMLEKKKVKYGMRVTSSEKVDKENRYAEFSLCCIPYPGCEFFRVLKSKDHVSQRVYFDWNQDYVDADLNLPAEIEMQIDRDWELYQRWDLATLTQNYFLLLLKTIVNSDEGVLVHCISGWDRTPLFISLLRLSLWADGKVHQSLNALEILYLTIAYDWLLFGHDLNDRIQRDEEVFFFCFHFLQYIMSDIYSTSQVSRCSSTTELEGREGPNSTTRNCEVEGNVALGQNLNDDNDSNSPNGSLCRSFFLGENHEQEYVVPESAVSPKPSSPSRTQAGQLSNQNGSTPLLVPQNSSIVNQQHCHSLSAGSWQIVSGTGSLCSAGSGSFQPSLPQHIEEPGNSLSSCEDVLEGEQESIRRTRLETVRTIFLTIYKETLGDGTQSGNATFSKFFDQVTDKLKNRWGK